MREQPTAAELLEAVSEFLRQEHTPAMSGRRAFHTRVAANVLDIVRRELAHGAAAERAEASRLAALLGREGETAALNAELCDRIAAGAIDAADPGLVEHLWATTLDTLAIDQPNYATYRREKVDLVPSPSAAGEGNRPYRPLNTGARFSRKLATPSL